ncbi:MAG: AbgT family transporter [Deltaproteobacteria bacterium]|nr:AbgT family transporter [Deltaproteobacteria bacterium]
MSALDTIERLGNKLPDPATLFLVGALGVIALSEIAVRLDWSVEKRGTREVREQVLGADGAPLIDAATQQPVTRAVLDPATGQVAREAFSQPLAPRSLLSSEGAHFALASLVDNFKAFPPLAVVLVGMLGIGLAERVGLIGVLLRAALGSAPPALLTPVVVFLGVSSSLATDAGYVVLPPVAAALYAAAGRSPLAGIAASIAGVAAGFSANLLPSGIDTIMMGFSTAAARLVAPQYEVTATANLYFMQASTILLTAVGWFVTARWVEPRLAAQGVAAPEASANATLSASEKRGLGAASVAFAVLAALLVAAVAIEGAPLHGAAGNNPKWVAAIVPLMFVMFFVPGLAYGFRAGTLKNDRDAARLLGESMAAMGPYIVLAFFAAQFIEYFRWSGLGEMLAIAGGAVLTRADLPAPLLLACFIVLVTAANLSISSMSAKYAFFAPVFVPMFMQVGISPELTQAAYRVGDSITNCITPLNPYLVISLVLMQRYAPKSGLGTLVAMMLPYSLAFLATWTLLLVAWVVLGIPLGPGAPLWFAPGQ